MGEWEWQNWEDSEAYRIGQKLYSEPECAANALRQDLQSIPPNRQLELIRKTQAATPYGSAGQVYETPLVSACGADSGQRDITVQSNRGAIEVMHVQPYAPQVCAPPPPPVVYRPEVVVPVVPVPSVNFDFDFRFGGHDHHGRRR